MPLAEPKSLADCIVICLVVGFMLSLCRETTASHSATANKGQVSLRRQWLLKKTK